MEQLTHLQNQFPFEEVKMDIMFNKFKLCIYYIYKAHAYCDYIRNILTVLWLPVSTREEVFIGYWVMNNAW